jgi:Pre-mRNA 3'-end-processing endonuclease polyadenylation factor C-term
MQHTHCSNGSEWHVTHTNGYVCTELLLQQTAKAVGALTEVLPTANKIGGLLVTKDFNSRLIAPQDLETYTQLKVSTCVLIHNLCHVISISTA